MPRLRLGHLILIVGVMSLAVAACAEPVVLHVAVDGSDEAVGSEAAPFRTLTRARDEVRRVKQAGELPDGGVRVIIHGGVHYLDEPLVLGPEDSGSAADPVVYAAADGARPVLSGGRVITGLQRNADGSWGTSIPAAADHKWVFRQLFVDGRRYIPARSPNDKPYFLVRGVAPEEGPGTAKDRFVFRDGDLENWPNLADVELLMYFSWNAGSFPLKSVDTDTNLAVLGGPAVWNLPKPGMNTTPYLVQNHPGACDAPGEWQLDRTTGQLRIIPFADEDLGAAEVIAPTMERLVIAEGVADEGRYVEHVRFEGLSFQHAGWELPATGFSMAQAASGLGAALEFHAARNIAVSGCEVAHVGRYGIWFGLDCSENVIRQNHLHDLGGGGVRLGTPDRPQAYDSIAHHNVVDNNFIHNGGHIHPGATGVYMAYGRNNTISHNEVTDLRYTGISLGWTWSITRSGTRENIVEYNHVHHVMRVLEDGGGIYTLGLTPGSVIRNNLVHDIGTPPDGVGHGIYIDGGSSGLLVENNICYDCGSGGIRQQHGSSCITVLNNISAFCRFGLGIDSERTNIFQYNIVLLDGMSAPFAYVPEWKSYNKIIDYNVYWRPDEQPIKFLSFTWEEWHEKQGIEDIWYTPYMDRHSRIADPLFVDAAARDFRLQPESPAIAMGFRPIDIDAIGLYGDEAWTSLPGSYEMGALLATETSHGMMMIKDDFDDAQPGQKPAYAAVVEVADAGAYLEISDERSLSPPHSVKFVDAPDQIYYMPHMYYSPKLGGDIRLRMTFDLYLEPGAMLWTEWRTTAAIEKVGPCIYIEADGSLLLNERAATGTVLPAEEWLHFEIEDGLGAFADALWYLKISNQAGEVLYEGIDLPCGAEFDRLKWLGFVSNGLVAAEMYLDNVELRNIEQ